MTDGYITISSTTISSFQLNRLKIILNYQGTHRNQANIDVSYDFNNTSYFHRAINIFLSLNIFFYLKL